MITSGIDTTSAITPATARELKARGVTFVAGYYGAAWKRLTVPTVLALKGAGLFTVSVFEGLNTSPGYFSTGQGQRDSETIVCQAAEVGQPRGSVIYVPADYDASPEDVPRILAYVNTVHHVLTVAGFDVGIYGSGLVLRAVRAEGAASKFWLAGATGWRESTEVRAEKWWNLCQGLPRTVDGIYVDPDSSNGDAGGWMTTF